MNSRWSRGCCTALDASTPTRRTAVPPLPSPTCRSDTAGADSLTRPPARWLARTLLARCAPCACTDRTCSPMPRSLTRCGAAARRASSRSPSQGRLSSRVRGRRSLRIQGTIPRPSPRATGAFLASLPTATPRLSALELDACPLVDDDALRGGGGGREGPVGGGVDALGGGAAAAPRPPGGLVALVRRGLTALTLRHLPRVTDSLLIEIMAIGGKVQATGGAAGAAAADDAAPRCRLTTLVIDDCAQVGPFPCSCLTASSRAGTLPSPPLFL